MALPNGRDGSCVTGFVLVDISSQTSSLMIFFQTLKKFLLYI